MSKKNQLKEVLAKGAVESTETSNVDVSVVVPDNTSSDSSTQEVLVDAKSVESKQTETETVNTVTDSEIDSVKTEVSTVDTVDTVNSVDSESVQETLNDNSSVLGSEVEKALSESTVVNRIASVLSNNVMTVMNEKFSEIVGGLNSTMEQLLAATSKNAEILVAQADAVSKILSGNSNEVVAAKSAVVETEIDQKINSPELDDLKRQIEELNTTVETLRKSAVSETVRKEHVMSPIRKPDAAQVLPKNFLGLPS